MKIKFQAKCKASTFARITFRIMCSIIFCVILFFRFPEYIYSQSLTIYTILVIGLPTLCFLFFIAHVAAFIIAIKIDNYVLTPGEKAVYLAGDTILAVIFFIIICFLLDPNPFPFQL